MSEHTPNMKKEALQLSFVALLSLLWFCSKIPRDKSSPPTVCILTRFVRLPPPPNQSLNGLPRNKPREGISRLQLIFGILLQMHIKTFWYLTQRFRLIESRLSLEKFWLAFVRHMLASAALDLCFIQEFVPVWKLCFGDGYNQSLLHNRTGLKLWRRYQVNDV